MSILDRPPKAPEGSAVVLAHVELAGLPAPVIAITGALFPGSISLEVDTDPEVPEQPFLVVTVEASGTVKDIVRRRQEWHARAEPFLGERDVRLSIVPK
ncbi:MAG TPA: hypothetical protein VMV69_29150 [Pirellulales bacterium]|nr:hypothetical protein [Pirellulales bacterium]